MFSKLIRQNAIRFAFLTTAEREAVPVIVNRVS
jgi:hypothetical protein